MNTGTQSPEQLFDYDVIDSTGNKIGSVDGVWADDATGQLEFVGVKTGWLMGKTHIIPAVNAQVGDGSIQVPYSEGQIKDSPSFGTDDALSPTEEDQIYDYYGVNRSTASSPTGLPSDTGTAGYTDTSSVGEEQRTRLHEEELQVGKRQVEAGRARIRKVVRSERQEVPVELRQEDVHIERTAATGGPAPDAFQEREIEVPITREEPVVGKEARVTGEVRVGKDVETETRTVGGEVRREEVEVDRDAGTTLRDDQGRL